MKKIILGLVGEIASGKGTAAQHLVETHKATTFKFSTPLRDVIKRMHIEMNRANLQTLSTMLRNQFGQDLLAKIIAEDVKQSDAEIIVVDGIRRLEDIKYLRELPEFKLLYVTADINKRYERIIKRGENADDNSKTFKQFELDHNSETELEIPQVAATAEITINNNGDLKELQSQIDKILSK